MSKNALVIFAKYPQKGKVKTRLAKDIGEEKALTIYTTLLKTIIQEHQNRRYDLIIGFTPKEKEHDFKKDYPELRYLAQEGNDLGERMHNAFKQLSNQYQKVIIVGADNPDVTEKTVNQAFTLLEDQQVILGPTFDGGYYLIGMKKPHNIFTNINWGSETVFEQTLQLIKEQQLTLSLLEKKHDIDTVNELEKHNISV